MVTCSAGGAPRRDYLAGKKYDTVPIKLQRILIRQKANATGVIAVNDALGNHRPSIANDPYKEQREHATRRLCLRIDNLPLNVSLDVITLSCLL